MADAQRFRWGWPVVALTSNTSPSASAHNLNGSTNGVAWVFNADDATPITALGYLYGSRTGTPPTYVIGLESVSASTGFPSGTYVQNGGVDCKATFTPPADATINGLWRTVTLAASYTPSAGEVLAITIRYSSGTVDGSNFSTIATHDAGPSLNFTVPSRPYALRLTTGSWAASVNMPIFGVYTASSCYGKIYQSLYSTATSATVGRRVAMAFTIPSSMCSTYKLMGFNCVAQLSSASGKAPKAGIWAASGGSLIQSVNVDVDQLRAVATARTLLEVRFTSQTALSAGSTYYAGFEVQDATNSAITLWGTQHASATELASEPGGSNFCLATYDGSNWSTDTTVRPYLELCPSDITAPSGGGSTGGFVIGA